MLRKIMIVLATAAALTGGLTAAARASAATKSHRITVHRSGPHAQGPARFPTRTVRQPQAVAALAIIKTSTTGDEWFIPAANFWRMRPSLSLASARSRGDCAA
jgi:hypothetical protein